MEQFKGQTRLPKFVIPQHYNLHLKTDLVGCTFSGEVKIGTEIIDPTKFIVLNALELDIKEALFTCSNKQCYQPVEIVLDGDDEIVILVFNEEIGVGDGELDIKFSGKLNEQLTGFYRCTYEDGGEKKNMAATQFEAVDARRCFPCWDEPALKATFRITVDVPPELTALSNMPVVEEKINENVKTVVFEESPPMSTYLVAVVVGLFEHIEDTTADGIKVCLYCALGKTEKGRYALSVAVKSLNLYSKYFSVPYPLPKLDMVAVPEFAGGAMENYGLITYRDNYLLFDEMLSSASRKQRLAIVQAHEVAHQWFGNLVTMEWWTHLWLNEGFATWVSYMAVDSFFPEWKIWTQFLRETADGLSADSLERSHPIEVDISHARSVTEIFDSISYEKGSAVMRMLQIYLGDDVIQRSLSSYMKRYAWKNAKTEDLWDVLQEESGVQVNLMMNSWTKQKGYPLISVKAEDHFLEFEQSHFLSSGIPGDGNWIVPITLLFGPHNKKMNFLLESKIQRVDISHLLPTSDGNSDSSNDYKGKKCDEHMWVKVNIEQSGFYRVKYDENLAFQLQKALENNSLSATDAFGILDDALALCKARKVPLSSLFALMDVYRKELDYVVLSKLIDACSRILQVFTSAVPSSVDQLKTFFINILMPSAEKLGWDSVPGESHLDALSRGEVYTALATLGHDKTHHEAIQRFQAFLSDKNTSLLSADMKKPTYLSIMRNASTTNRSGFESLLKVYRETDSVQEKETILRCLSYSPDPELVREVLNFLVSDEVRDQDVVYGLLEMSLEGRETAWKWLMENWDPILKHYGSGLLIHNFIKDIISPLCSNQVADEVEEFFATRTSHSIEMNLKQSIEIVRNKARWVESIKQENSLEEIVQQLACKG